MEPGEAQLETNPEGDQFIDDLLSDALPGEGDSLNPDQADPKPGGEGQPEGEPKPEEGKPEGKVEPKPEPKAAQPEPDALPRTWEYKGKQYTVDQMVEMGVLDDVIQTARQFPTIQTKYQGLLEERATAPVVSEAAPAPQGPSGDQILQAYTPIMQEMANQGYIEPEAFEVFPKLVSALMFHRDLLYDVRNIVASIVQNSNAQSEVSDKQNALAYVNGICDKVSGEGEHFAVLKDAETRQKFYEYLGTLNVPIKQVTEDFVRKQWVAYNSDPMLEAVRLAASSGKEADIRTRRNAKGEGGGVRPGPAKAIPKGSDEELIRSFLE